MKNRAMSNIEKSLREKDRNDCLRSLYSDDSLSQDEADLITKAGFIPALDGFSKEEFLAMYYSIVDEIESGADPANIAASIMSIVSEKVYEIKSSEGKFEPKTKSGKKGFFRRVE